MPKLNWHEVEVPQEDVRKIVHEEIEKIGVPSHEHQDIAGAVRGIAERLAAVEAAVGGMAAKIGKVPPHEHEQLAKELRCISNDHEQLIKDLRDRMVVVEGAARHAQEMVRDAWKAHKAQAWELIEAVKALADFLTQKFGKTFPPYWDKKLDEIERKTKAKEEVKKVKPASPAG